MNILELCLSPGLGGLELYVYRSAKELEKKHNVLAVLDKTGKLANHFKDNSAVKVTRLKYSSGYLPIFIAHQLARIIDTNNIEVIHMHWGNDLALAALAKRMSQRKPALIYTRQMQITRSKNDFYHNFLYQQMDLMLTITKQLENNAKNFISKFSDRISTLYYGVGKPSHILNQSEIKSERHELALSSDDFVIGLFGRLETNKGQHLLIEALSLAKKDNINLKAIIVGHEMKRGYRASLVELANSLNVIDNVIFKEFLNDPQRLMQVCDCVVLATYEETFGLVIPEAMRCGVAVIGSNRGGVPEIIEHESTGLLFDTKDSLSLYEQIKRLYINPELRKKLAEKGRISANTRFDYTAHYDRLEKYMVDAIAKTKLNKDG